MVIPVGLPDAQQLLVNDKDINGKVRTKEIMQVSRCSRDPTSLPSEHRDMMVAEISGRRSCQVT